MISRYQSSRQNEYRRGFPRDVFSVCAVFPLRLLGDGGQERPHSEPSDTVLLPKFLRQNPAVGFFPPLSFSMSCHRSDRSVNAVFKLCAVRVSPRLRVSSDTIRWRQITASVRAEQCALSYHRHFNVSIQLIKAAAATTAKHISALPRVAVPSAYPPNRVCVDCICISAGATGMLKAFIISV